MRCAYSIRGKRELYLECMLYEYMHLEYLSMLYRREEYNRE